MQTAQNFFRQAHSGPTLLRKNADSGRSKGIRITNHSRSKTASGDNFGASVVAAVYDRRLYSSSRATCLQRDTIKPAVIDRRYKGRLLEQLMSIIKLAKNPRGSVSLREKVGRSVG